MKTTSPTIPMDCDVPSAGCLNLNYWILLIALWLALPVWAQKGGPPTGGALPPASFTERDGTIITCCRIDSPNIVLNPDFDEHSENGCPPVNPSNNIDMADHWYSGYPLVPVWEPFWQQWYQSVPDWTFPYGGVCNTNTPLGFNFNAFPSTPVGGFAFMENYYRPYNILPHFEFREYLGQHLDLEAGQQYCLEITASHLPENIIVGYDLVVYGVNTASFPIAGATPDLAPEEIAGLDATPLATVTFDQIQNDNSEWVTYSFEFTAPMDFNAIMIGPGLTTHHGTTLYIMIAEVGIKTTVESGYYTLPQVACIGESTILDGTAVNNDDDGDPATADYLVQIIGPGQNTIYGGSGQVGTIDLTLIDQQLDLLLGQPIDFDCDDYTVRLIYRFCGEWYAQTETITMSNCDPDAFINVYGETNANRFQKAEYDPDDDCFYVCGIENGGALFGRLSNTGDLVWMRRYSQIGQIVNFARLNNGHFILAGRIHVNGLSQLHLLRIRPDGSVVWSRAYGTPNIRMINATIAPAGNNQFFVASWYNIQAPVQRASKLYIARIDGRGDRIWERLYEDRQDHGAFIGLDEMVAVDGGAALIVGRTHLNGADRAFIIRVEGNGNVSMARRYNDSFSNFDEVTTTQDGGFVAAGFRTDGGNSSDPVLVKMDAAFNVQWSRTFADNNTLGFGTVVEAPNGHLYVAGIHQDGLSQLYIQEYSANGNLLESVFFGQSAFQANQTGGTFLDWIQNDLFDGLLVVDRKFRPEVGLTQGNAFLSLVGECLEMCETAHYPVTVTSTNTGMIGWQLDVTNINLPRINNGLIAVPNYLQADYCCPLGGGEMILPPFACENDIPLDATAVLIDQDALGLTPDFEIHIFDGTTTYIYEGLGTIGLINLAEINDLINNLSFWSDNPLDEWICGKKYSVKIIYDQCGERQSQSASIFIECCCDDLTATLHPKSLLEVCTGDANGRIGVFASGGSGPYTFEWEDGNGNVIPQDFSLPNGSAIINLSPGKYSVTITDSEGCSRTFTYHITAINCVVCKIQAAFTIKVLGKGPHAVLKLLNNSGPQALIDSSVWTIFYQGSEILNLQTTHLAVGANGLGGLPFSEWDDLTICLTVFGSKEQCIDQVCMDIFGNIIGKRDDGDQQPFGNSTHRLECQVYPNPSTGILHIRSSEAATVMRLYAIGSGQLVFEQYEVDAGTVTLSTEHLPAGLYALQVIAESGQQYTEQIVVQ